ncbi:4-(cytidine 5'-diphospho)-2-C-methyl-D-erythritol kinase [Phyllobacterium bourgognense]|uniref:4-diphosphocytidyl-2-C-methyl-D-erythritol kinase n=1 Tax=Phyllobacterium bourgognense TaxID=314236 RepID=A0A368Z6C0_9HYPH|nr:4-(cytidine 5'-diphospho)-2-C-methyl-D-erythritol kinase [Phyllobacterium bourgognense]RCW87963.1 4-diphosphocytidyl-2-C-methyl-D-erythritol kinase [Phyllobacterium bourgognense]
MLDSVEPRALERTISLIAPAKINLALHVTGRRDDGYHLLDSLVVFAHIGDKVSATPAPFDSFEVSGPFGRALPDDETNLVLKARNALRARFPEKGAPVAIHLEKHLPIASGIGGGSSDAAATLRALTVLWGIETNELAAIGLTLGADVPMCLYGQPLIARGIGEEIEGIDGFPHLPMVLVNSGLATSTPQVFSALVKRDNQSLPALPNFSSVHDVCLYLGQTDNHLFSAAEKLTPAIGDAMKALRSTDPRLVRMSGSGGTCFAIYGSDHEAEAAAAALKRAQPGWFVVATHNGMERS